MKNIAAFIIVFVSIVLSDKVYSFSGADSILVKVGNKTISVNEFMMRSEYTVRPVYCKGNTNLDKKIILNSLIAEKLLALEAGENNEFITKEEVKTYLLGRKEQTMRAVLFNDEITSRVPVDTARIMKSFDYAGREYQVEYANIKDSTIAKQIVDEITTGDVSFSDLMTGKYGVSEVPARNVAWGDAEHPAILEALFTRDLKMKDAVGPVKTAEGEFVIIYIKGWTDSPVVTETQRAERFNKINNTYQTAETKKLYEDYVRGIMKNKELVFNKNVFTALADVFGPVYMKSSEEREKELKNKTWNYSEEKGEYEQLKPALDQLRGEILFTINGRKWTVDNCLDYMKRHPLVFREKTFPQEEFGFQLQLAILDMIRDKYVTESAYAKGYDKLPAVVHDNNIWKDNLNAINEKFRIMTEAGKDSLWRYDNIKVIEEVLNPKIDELQKKYSDKIYINTELFNNIKLLRVDMALAYTASPFIRVVPDFPALTTDNKLNYGNVVK